MKRRRKQDLWFAAILLVLVVSLVYEGFRLFRPASEEVNAGQMLFEVSQFQMQVLSTALLDASGSTHTNQLNGLKLAAYSAAYTHERLVKTFGEGSIDPLSSISKLVNIISEWQIGGDRPLSEEEREMLEKYSDTFPSVLPPYQKLLSSGGQIIASKNREISQVSKQLDSLVQAKEE